LNWLVEQVSELKRFKPATLVSRRYDKFREIGAVTTR
jgi:acetyl-CoA carboxylase alpha subunit